MREKKPALIITFPSTAAAMEAESFCLEQGLPGRIIPVPREITAGCGLAWKAPPEAEAQREARELAHAQSLKAYKELLDAGALTQEEFDRKKAELLGL